MKNSIMKKSIRWIKESSITEEIRKKRGDEFEEKIYKKLIKQHPKHIKIKKDDDRFEKTKEALRKGYDLIHKAYFKYEGWVGEKGRETGNFKCLQILKIRKPNWAAGDTKYTTQNSHPLPNLNI